MSRESHIKHQEKRVACADCNKEKAHKCKFVHVAGRLICEDCVASQKLKPCPGQHCMETHIHQNETVCATCRFMARMNQQAQNQKSNQV